MTQTRHLEVTGLILVVSPTSPLPRVAGEGDPRSYHKLSRFPEENGKVIEE